MAELRAGVGRARLTPALGTSLVGFAGRQDGCTAIHDDLLATALVLDDGTTQIAIVSCDLLSLHPELVRLTRTLVEDATGIPGEHIMLCCTHTHSGPPGYVGARSRPSDQAYATYLPYQIAGTVRLAAADLAPARIGSGQGRATIAINRRQLLSEGQITIGENPDGPTDDAVGILHVERTDGTPCATVVNYACHPVILGPSSLQASADFVGHARQVVEAATGTHLLYLQGACADLNPLGGVQRDYSNCARLGTVLAGEILRVYGSIRASKHDVRLTVAGELLTLPTAPLTVQTQVIDGPQIVAERLDEEFPWAADSAPGGVHVAVQGLGIGDVAIVGMACEPFVETGLEIKRRSSYSQTFVAGYTNGCVGYVPTAGAYAHGGYEVQIAHLFYRVPEPVVPAAEQVLVDACLHILRMHDL